MASRNSSISRNETIQKRFGEAVRMLRLKRGLSQEQLGFESGYHRTYISQLERGLKNPSLNTVFDLAKVLEVSPSSLIQIIEDPKSKGPKARGGGNR